MVETLVKDRSLRMQQRFGQSLLAVIVLVVLVATTTPASVLALDNGLARTPPMGFNTWNHFGCDVSEQIIKTTADIFVSEGLRDAGYQYVNLDDCVFVGRDPTTGVLLPDPQRFPSGIAALSQYVHDRGLKMGIYTDAGYKTCQGRPGIFGYELLDAQSYASWGIDYLKIDWCYTTGMDPHDRYANISQAFRAVERPILLSACEWGVDKPWQFMSQYMNSWRTTGDISAQWERIMQILEAMEGLGKYAGPGGWNDPDMLEVGNSGLSQNEQIAHFSLWSLMSSPLLLGNDLSSLTDGVRQIVLNKEVIAVNQDTASVGDVVWKEPLVQELQIWAKLAMKDGSRVAVLLNKGLIEQKVTVFWKQLNIAGSAECRIRDLWQHKDVAARAKLSYTAIVPAHSVVMIQLWCSS